MSILDFHRGTRRTRQILLTPLIDVVYLLLLFFMISTTFVKAESIELTLPAKDGAAKEKPPDSLHIYINDGGELFLDKQKLNEESLRDRLIDVFGNVPNQRVVLASAQQISVQKLVGIMDMIYLCGGRNLSVVEWREAAQASAPAAVEAKP